jgi:hypothetical protein
MCYSLKQTKRVKTPKRQGETKPMFMERPQKMLNSDILLTAYLMLSGTHYE